MIVGDFNFIRKPKDRNRPGGSVEDMLMFNNAISSLGLVEIPLHARKFTWINKQNPFLKDWIGSSLLSPGQLSTHTIAHSLVMEVSDHWPCVVEIKTSLPKGRIFRFENCWMSHEGILPLVASSWNSPSIQHDAAKIILAKFKSLSSGQRRWQSQLSNLRGTIANVKLVISLLDSIEEWRGLTLQEGNFRDILNQKIVD